MTEPLTPYEVATGFPIGSGDGGRASGRRRPHGLEEALGALDRLVLKALERPPCIVHFSGGRDSSAILAVATGLARRHGLALPVPLTLRYPGQPEAEESHWQELVLRHLALDDWVVMDASEDADLLGPAAQAVLRRHGVIWSPVLATRVPSMVPAAGGSLLSGEGGDEVLGRRRPAPLAGLARARRPGAAVSSAKSSAGELMPRWRREARLRKQLTGLLGLQWLQPDVRRSFLARAGALWADEPVNWAAAINWVTSCRHVRLGVATMSALAGEVGASLQTPFTDPDFVGALGGAFGFLGPVSRTATMRALFGKLLPAEVIERRAKAVFTLPAWGPQAREFAASWSGGGLDANLVDVEVLRRHWAGPRPSALTFGLLQAAWLAEQASSRPL